MSFYSRALNEYERELGSDNILTLSILDRIGKWFDRYEMEFRSQDSFTIDALDHIGKIYDTINSFEAGDESIGE